MAPNHDLLDQQPNLPAKSSRLLGHHRYQHSTDRHLVTLNVINNGASTSSGASQLSRLSSASGSPPPPPAAVRSQPTAPSNGGFSGRRLFKFNRAELLEFMREEIYCTLGSSATGMTLSVLVSHFSEDAREDILQFARYLGFCSVNEMLRSEEFSDIVEPTVTDHVLGAANQSNAFCYKVVEKPRTRHIIQVLKDRASINEAIERQRRAALLNPANEATVLEGKERLFSLAARLGAETGGVFFGDIQAEYLREHGVQLDKKELKKYFQRGRIKDVIDNLLFDDVKLFEDSKRTGSLYLKLKKPLEEILADSRRITLERERFLAAAGAAKVAERKSHQQHPPSKQQNQRQQLLEQYHKQKQQQETKPQQQQQEKPKYEPELVPVVRPSEYLYTDDVKIAEKYTGLQIFSDEFEAALARSRLALADNASASTSAAASASRIAPPPSPPSKSDIAPLGKKTRRKATIFCEVPSLTARENFGEVLVDGVRGATSSAAKNDNSAQEVHAHNINNAPSNFRGAVTAPIALSKSDFSTNICGNVANLSKIGCSSVSGNNAPDITFQPNFPADFNPSRPPPLFANFRSASAQKKHLSNRAHTSNSLTQNANVMGLARSLSIESICDASNDVGAAARASNFAFSNVLNRGGGNALNNVDDAHRLGARRRLIFEEGDHPVANSSVRQATNINANRATAAAKNQISAPRTTAPRCMGAVNRSATAEASTATTTHDGVSKSEFSAIASTFGASPTKAWSSSSAKVNANAADESKKSLADVLSRIENLDFDTASVCSSSPRKAANFHGARKSIAFKKPSSHGAGDRRFAHLAPKPTGHWRGNSTSANFSNASDVVVLPGVSRVPFAGAQCGVANDVSNGATAPTASIGAPSQNRGVISNCSTFNCASTSNRSNEFKSNANVDVSKRDLAQRNCGAASSLRGVANGGVKFRAPTLPSAAMTMPRKMSTTRQTAPEPPKLMNFSVPPPPFRMEGGIPVPPPTLPTNNNINGSQIAQSPNSSAVNMENAFTAFPLVRRSGESDLRTQSALSSANSGSMKLAPASNYSHPPPRPPAENLRFPQQKTFTSRTGNGNGEDFWSKSRAAAAPARSSSSLASSSSSSVVSSCNSQNNGGSADSSKRRTEVGVAAYADVAELRASIDVVMAKRNVTAIKAAVLNSALEALYGRSVGGTEYLVTFVRRHLNDNMKVLVLPTDEIMFAWKAAG